MEVAAPVAPVDFHFDSACSSPYITAPSSPQPFGNFFFNSNPTTPSRASSRAAAFFSDDDDFEFDFSGQLERTSLSAEELFDGGIIRAFKPPPTPHRVSDSAPATEPSPNPPARERETTLVRVSDIIADSERENPSKDSKPTQKDSVSSFLSSFSLPKSSRRWRIRDLLLFRSASEGRAAEKKAEAEEAKNWSFRSSESVGGSSRRRGEMSAHEMHYRRKRAVSEELRKKTTLPYKHGLLGCLGFNSSMHSLSRGIGSLTRG